MANIVLGAPGAIEQPKKYSGSPFQASLLTRTWRGPKAAIQQLASQISALGFVWSVEDSAATSTLTATFPLAPNGDPSAEIPIDSWELVPNVVEKDILESDTTVANALTIADKEKLRKAVADHVHATVTSFSSAAQTAGIADLQELMFCGLKGVKVFAPVLRLTRVSSSNYAVKFSLANIGKILANTTVFGIVPSTFQIAFDAPPYTLSSGNALFAYGWYKGHPTLQTVALGRIQIVQEYEFGLWARLLYNNPL